MILKPLSCRHPAFPALYGYPTSANLRKNAHAHLSTGAAQYGCIKASNGWSRKNQTKHHSSRCNRHFNADSLGGRHKHAPPKQVLPDEEVSCEVIFWQETSSTGSTIEEIDDLENIIVTSPESSSDDVTVAGGTRAWSHLSCKKGIEASSKPLGVLIAGYAPVYVCINCKKGIEASSEPFGVCDKCNTTQRMTTHINQPNCLLPTPQTTGYHWE